MQRKKYWLLGLATLTLGFATLAAWHYRVPGLVMYWFAMQTQDERWQRDGVWLPHYRVAVEGKVVEGVDENASGLTYSDATGTLFSITNKNPKAVLEIDTDGRLLRSIALEGTKDPEGITHVRDNIFAIVDEREQAVYRVEINPDTTRIDVGASARLGLSLGASNNLGFEGISWDSARQRLFISQEKDPLRVLVVTGLPEVLAGSAFDLQINDWRPAYADAPFMMDLSSLSLHEATGNLLLMSDESALLVEYDPDGKPVSMLPMWAGFHGLKQRVPQAEGLALGPDGTIYVMSEPNLFYRFERSVPAAWAK